MGVQAVADITKLDLEEAERVVQSFKDNLPGVMQFERDLKEFARKNGYVPTVYGTRCRFPNYALPPIEVKSHDGSVVNKEIREKIIRTIEGVWRYDEKNALRRDLEQRFGVRIFDNSGYIKEDETRILNAVIQGRHSTALIY